MNPVRISAYDRLRSLPDVFSLNAIARHMAQDIASVKVSLSRWADRGLIAHAGPRSGVYYNLVVNPNARSECLHQVIQSMYPEAVLSEASVLNVAGWTTQVPRSLQINVLYTRSHVDLFGVDIHLRPKSWFITMHDHGAMINMDEAESIGFSSYGLRSLKPEWALVDTFIHKDGWKPDDDDLDIPDDAWTGIALAHAIMTGKEADITQVIMYEPSDIMSMIRPNDHNYFNDRFY